MSLIGGGRVAVLVVVVIVAVAVAVAVVVAVVMLIGNEAVRQVELEGGQFDINTVDRQCWSCSSVNVCAA